MAQNQQRVTEMAQPLAESEKKLSDMRAVHEEHAGRVASVQAAIDAAAAAEETLPGDEVLTEVSEKLTTRLVALQTEMSQAQSDVDSAQADTEQKKTAYDEAAQQLSQAVAERDQRQQAVQQAEAAVEAARSDLASAQLAVDSAVNTLTKRWSADFTVAALKPLTPEQLCWSLLKVTGVYDRQRRAAAAKLAEENPMSEEDLQDPQLVAGREQQIEQQTSNALKQHLATFVKFYGAAAGQPQNDFFATADQALFAANAGVLNSWINPAEGNLTERIVGTEDSRLAAEELYLTVLNRHPSEEEISEVAGLLEQRTEDRPAAAKELVWGLMTSIEFRFNH